MDWFGDFPGPEAENDNGNISLEYTANDGIHSLDGSDDDGTPHRRRFPKFNINDLHREVSLEHGMIFPTIQIVRKTLR